MRRRCNRGGISREFRSAVFSAEIAIASSTDYWNSQIPLSFNNQFKNKSEINMVLLVVNRFINYVEFGLLALFKKFQFLPLFFFGRLFCKNAEFFLITMYLFKKIMILCINNDILNTYITFLWFSILFISFFHFLTNKNIFDKFSKLRLAFVTTHKSSLADPTSQNIYN